MNDFYILGGVLVGLGLLLRYHVGKERFKRRGVGGLQHYSSYGKGLAVGAFETFLNFIGTLLLAFGILMLVVTFFSSDEEKEEAVQIEEQVGEAVGHIFEIEERDRASLC